MDPFIDRLAAAVKQKNPVLVGLDPRAEQLPPGLLPCGAVNPRDVAAAYESFCRGIIDVVAPLVPAVKPQAAFFEQIGPAGMTALASVIAHATSRGLIVILDAKRGDIGSTAAAYADGLLGRGAASPWGADAVTVNPYLGDDSLAPFVQVAGQRAGGIFVLVKTSNPGGRLFQDRLADGQPMYRHVGDYVETLAAETASACGYGRVGAVVGATYPEQLAELRQAMPHTWFLVPGYGSQGGTADDVQGAFDPQGLGAVVSSSRGIIFAHARPEYRERFGGERWQQAAEAACLAMIDELAGCEEGT